MQLEDSQLEHQDFSQEIPDPVIPLPPRPRGRASSPFNMIDFMHKTSSYKLDQVFRAADAMPSIPVHVPCERPGGGARRAISKASAANIPRSVSEVFAYSTTCTLLAEDTAVVLETFGNVSSYSVNM